MSRLMHPAWWRGQPFGVATLTPFLHQYETLLMQLHVGEFVLAPACEVWDGSRSDVPMNHPERGGCVVGFRALARLRLHSVRRAIFTRAGHPVLAP